MATKSLISQIKKDHAAQKRRYSMLNKKYPGVLSKKKKVTKRRTVKKSKVRRRRTTKRRTRKAHFPA